MCSIRTRPPIASSPLHYKTAAGHWIRPCARSHLVRALHATQRNPAPRQHGQDWVRTAHDRIASRSSHGSVRGLDMRSRSSADYDVLDAIGYQRRPRVSIRHAGHREVQTASQIPSLLYLCSL